jgi:hypothetical protein
MKKLIQRFHLARSLLAITPLAIALWVWLSPLAFIPVPWPDDSAFYFVAKELFKWPPRWVMLPQAPFEPTYRVFNFNTMPLYPILIGLGRFVGIDGSFLLKFWPLAAWGLTGSLLVTALNKRGLPFVGCFLLALVFASDPEMRWASVLVRPESLIGLFGMSLVLGLTFGFPQRFRPRKLWDPVSFLLALTAYAHFNAIHLVWPVLFAFAFEPERLLRIAGITALYLSPWILLVLTHLNVFLTQMATQWTRLDVGNEWLKSPSEAINSLFQSLGNPDPWPDALSWGSVQMWLITIGALLYGISTLLHEGMNRILYRSPAPLSSSPSLFPALGWIAGSIWLWNSKPEVWFVYYIHVAIWTFTGIAALKLWTHPSPERRKILISLSLMMMILAGLFNYVNLSQAVRMSKSETWKWATYHQFVDCVDHRLVALEKNLGPRSTPFKVWCPTFPDITIELSRRHPQWELSRTNDFAHRNDMAVQHGWDTDAVVVTETLTWEERSISGPASQYPQIESTWMNWKEYFLNRLFTAPGWKPNRWVCQKGRWQAFLYMVPESAAHSSSGLVPSSFTSPNLRLKK